MATKSKVIFCSLSLENLNSVDSSSNGYISSTSLSSSIVPTKFYKLKLFIGQPISCLFGISVVRSFGTGVTPLSRYD